MKQFVAITLLVCIFFSLKQGNSELFEIYTNYYLVIILSPIFFFKYVKNIPLSILLLFFLLLLIGLYNIMKENNNIQLFMKSWSGAFYFYLFYFFILKYYNFNIKYIFSLYMKGAYLSSYIVLLQLLSYLIGFKYGYDFSYLNVGYGRFVTGEGVSFYAFFSEPAHFAITISPAVFVAVNNFFIEKKKFITSFQCYTIIISLILSTSSTGFLSLFLSLFFIGVKKVRITLLPLIILISFITAYILYENIPKFKHRVNSFLVISQKGEDFDTTETDDFGSSFVLYNNWNIALLNLSSNPILGTGLGSHLIASQKYASVTNIRFKDLIKLNNEDGNSLFIRMLSETGLLGVVLLFLFLFNYYIYKPADIEYWIISNACLVLILLHLLRDGHYFIYASPLFFMMYYYANKQSKKQIFKKK